MSKIIRTTYLFWPRSWTALDQLFWKSIFAILVVCLLFQKLGRITTLVLCRQSPLNLHQFCLTRNSKYGWLELIGTPSDGILHQSDCTWLSCLLCQYATQYVLISLIFCQLLKSKQMKKFMYQKANEVQFYDFTRVQNSEDMRIEMYCTEEQSILH